ncbi:MAG: IS110 family transposase [Actinomycetota bacterium]
MDQLHDRCCGIDVHQAELTACVRLTEGKKNVTEHVQTFGTMTSDLLAVRDWLRAHRVTHVAMEATGVYWKCVYYALEDDFEVILVNAAHIKHVPGRKTDTIDAAWIAQLLAHGLLRASFVPPPPIRRLRDLTRYRKALTGERTSEVNRIHKVLVDAGIKLATVASSVMGVSGRAMMAALIEGSADPQALADLARGRLRAKLPALREALAGHFDSHHAFLLERMLAHVADLEADIEALSERIADELRPFERKVELLDTIPGVGRLSAEVIVAEIGIDMSQFPTPKHLASWAHLCPGQHESAGKRRSARVGKGPKWLRTNLIECAQTASRGKGTYLSERYRQLLRRRGHRKAIVALAHEILVVSWHVLSTDQPYIDPGPDAARKNSEAAIRNRAVRQLRALGYSVNLEHLQQPA